MAITEDGFAERFASSAVKRIGRDRLLRNVAVALGNTGDASAIPVLEDALSTESDLVKEHAAWAIQAIRAREGRDKTKGNDATKLSD